MVYGISDISGYDPIALKRYMIYYMYAELGHYPDDRAMTLCISSGNSVSLTELDSPLLDLLNLKYSFLKEKGSDGSLTGSIIVNQNCLPRFFMVPDYKILEDELEILEKLNSEEFEPQKYIILEEKPEINVKPEKLIKYNIKNVVYLPDEIIIDLYTENSGFLFLSEIYYPGWKAWIDIEPAHIYRANFLFRALYIDEPGDHKIKLSYRPASYVTGKYITLISIIICLVVLIYISILKVKGKK